MESFTEATISNETDIVMTIIILSLVSYIFFPIISIETCYSIILLFPKLQPQNLSIGRKFQFINALSPLLILLTLLSIEFVNNQTLNKALTQETIFTVVIALVLLIKETTKLFMFVIKIVSAPIRIIYLTANILILLILGLAAGYSLTKLRAPLLPILIGVLTITLSLQVGSTAIRYIYMKTSQGLDTLIHESILFSSLFILLIPTTLLIEDPAVTINTLLDTFALALIVISVILTFIYDFKKNFRLTLTFSLTTIYIIFGFFYSQISPYSIQHNSLLGFGLSLILCILLISLSQSLFVHFTSLQNNSTVY